MTEKHTYLSFVIDEMADKLKKQVKLLQDNEAFIAKSLEDEQFEKRVAAEARVQELEEELKQTVESFNDLRERHRASTNDVRRVRTLLNGNGTGRSIEVHAQMVFKALCEANPEHPLVKHNPERPEK